MRHARQTVERLARRGVGAAMRGSVERGMRLLVVSIVLLVASGARAQVALPLTEAEPGQIRVDGALRDWSGVRFLNVGSGSDASMRVALAYDGAGLYVGAEVRDDRMIRSATPGTAEDAIVLTLAMPRGRGSFVGSEIWLWAGQAGRSSARAGVGEIGRPGAAGGAQIVEAPGTAGGYSVEAFVPWNSIPGASRWQEGRGSVRLRDVDQAAHPDVEDEPAIAEVDPAHLDRMPALRPTGGPSAALDAFLASRGLEGATPAHDLRGDVGEDARAERVSIVDRFVVVTGDGWQEGRGYSFMQLPISAAADIRGTPRLVELTGDGKSELVLTLRQIDARGAREVWQVVELSSGQPRTSFAIETRKETGGGTVETTVRVTPGRRGQLPTIEARVGTARGLDASTLAEMPATDAEPILLPWGAVRARRYRWDGHAFARIEETPNPDYVDPAAQAAASASSGTTASVETPPPPPAMDDLLAAFRRERGIGSARPTFRAQANVAASAEPEQVVVYGRDLVVVGPAFRSGTGWFHFEIPAHDAADVLDVRTADVTSDARHEVLVRVRQAIGAVRREVLLVFQFTPTGFPCLLQREVAREEARNRIENEIATAGGRLEIRPGTARGWSQATWPYSDAPAGDGVELPLLPWRDSPVVFRYQSGRLVH
jgi:hypothetical protein